MLSDNQIAYPRANDLDRLLHLLEAAEITQPPGAQQLVSLTPWATRLRYEDPPEAISLGRRATVTLVDDMVDWASTQIPKNADVALSRNS